jgi:transcriptional regulator with XRE-family HTH domain
MNKTKTIHNQEYSNLIDMLGQERKRLGLSQTEVARRLNMTQSDISKIESDERRLDVLEFKALLKVYRIGENLKLKELVTRFLELDE